MENVIIQIATGAVLHDEKHCLGFQYAVKVLHYVWVTAGGRKQGHHSLFLQWIVDQPVRLIGDLSCAVHGDALDSPSWLGLTIIPNLHHLTEKGFADRSAQAESSGHGVGGVCRHALDWRGWKVRSRGQSPAGPSIKGRMEGLSHVIGARKFDATVQ